MKHLTPIFYPKLSIYLFFYVLLAHVFAAVCLIVTLHGVLLVLLLCGLFATSVFYVRRYVGVFSTVQLAALQYIADKKWCLQMIDGKSVGVVLAESSIVTRYLMILHFVEQQTSKKHVFLLLPDSLPREQLKLIRRCAKLGMM